MFALIMVVLSMFARRAMLHFGFWRAVRVMLLVVAFLDGLGAEQLHN